MEKNYNIRCINGKSGNEILDEDIDENVLKIIKETIEANRHNTDYEFEKEMLYTEYTSEIKREWKERKIEILEIEIKFHNKRKEQNKKLDKKIAELDNKTKES